MSKFSNRVLAVTAGLCLVSSIASAEGMHISYKGLDLARPQDAAVFQSRVDGAARTMCQSYISNILDSMAERACRRAVSDEAEAALPDVQRRAFARGRQAEPAIVSAQR